MVSSGIDKNSILINKDEVLRYLGYKNQVIDDNLIDLVDECIKLTLTTINPRYIYIKHTLDLNNDTLRIEGSRCVLEGRDIEALLKNSSECILSVATLGVEIEKLIKIFAYKDMTKSLILDACATTAIEAVCDLIEINIKSELKDSKENITYRYSPGYGDLPIEANKLILDILDAQKNIGLTITNHNLLIPRKSVVAIMGVIDNNKSQSAKVCNIENKCINCPNYNNCSYRKEV